MLNKNTSVRRVANRAGIHWTTVQNVKKKYGIKTNKCIKVPKYVENQEKRAKTNCRKLYRKSVTKVLVIDDETYVPCDPRQACVQKFFNFKNKDQVPHDVRYKPIEKFPKKYLVWQAMDDRGHVSKPYVKIGTMKAKEYLSECIEKILLPFLQKYKIKSNALFWPDLATIHYAKVVQNWFRANGIEFVEKESNPPNCPQARPIEKFWAICKREYSMRTRVPKNLKEFEKIWTEISEKMAKTHAKQTDEECQTKTSTDRR